jgi:hypothetical protein
MVLNVFSTKGKEVMMRMELLKVLDERFFRLFCEKRNSFRLALNGGAYTRYSIWPYRGKDESKKGSHFRVKSHFSETTETVTMEEIMDPNRYNFKEGIEKGALYIEA